MKKIFPLFAVFFICFLCACSGEVPPVDYAVQERWLSLPASPDKPVDVFYLYPTVWHKESANEPDTCAIDNKSMIAGANAVFTMQASLFQDDANIFAPYYRQGYAPYILSLPFDERMAFLEKITAKDVLNAFDYYIKNLNGGRPFILAGHSQGAMMLQPILFKYMKEHPDVYARMIAAYPIGYAFTQQDLDNNPHLKFAGKADDTGVIISYNTQGPDVRQQNPLVAPGSLVINPISWTRGKEKAPASENLGTVFFDNDGKPILLTDFADAQVDIEKGVVICSTPECASTSNRSGLFPKGVYHGADIPFYYNNLKKNAQDRIKAYFQHAS